MNYNKSKRCTNTVILRFFVAKVGQRPGDRKPLTRAAIGDLTAYQTGDRLPDRPWRQRIEVVTDYNNSNGTDYISHTLFINSNFLYYLVIIFIIN